MQRHSRMAPVLQVIFCPPAYAFEVSVSCIEINSASGFPIANLSTQTIDSESQWFPSYAALHAYLAFLPHAVANP